MSPMYTLILSRRDEAVGVMPPPPGIIPNFVDPPSKGHLIIISIIVCTTISFIFMAIRVYTALSITRNVSVDDYLLIVAWFFGLVYSILNSINTKYGLGRHLWDITFSTLNPRFMQIGAISGSFFGLSLMLTKLSILTLFLRFVGTGGKLRTSMHIIMVVIVLYTLIGSFDWVYSCRPMQKYWDLTITTGSCVYWLKISIFSCVMNTLTDVAILILPAIILRNLHVPRKQKIGVILVLMTGGFVLVITLIKLQLTVRLASKTDITWEIVTSNIWWSIELHLAIVCACLPTLKPLLRNYVPKIFGSNFTNSTGTKRHATRSASAHRFPTSHAGNEPEEIILETSLKGASKSTTTVENGEEQTVTAEYASERGLIITSARDVR